VKTLITLGAAAVLATFMAGTDPALAYMCGDVNQSGSINASDALQALKVAVGQPVGIDCGLQTRTLKTGQTKCFDTSGNQFFCGGSGFDGDLQIGAPRSFVDNEDGTVTDRGTGLEWEQFSDDGGIHDQDNLYTYAEAFSVKIAALNSANFAGHNDWRLPNQFELLSRVNFGQIAPASYSPYFDHDCTPSCSLPACSCTSDPGHEWASTTYLPSPAQAWQVGFANGIPFSSPKTLTHGARGVRGGYTSVQINGDPVLAGSCADVNGSDTITSADALAILRKGVGQEVDLACILRSPLQKTGQTQCYNTAGTVVACAGTGQDGEFQKGLDRAYTDNADGTVTDENTGLIWELFSADGGLHDGGFQYVWAGSVGAKLAAVNTAAFTGHTDWRVPNVFELLSLTDLGHTDPAFSPNSVVFDCQPGCSSLDCGCQSGTGKAWSSTSWVNPPTAGVLIDFATGKGIQVGKSEITNVRVVRGGY
jgi:hypothetical protein